MSGIAGTGITIILRLELHMEKVSFVRIAEVIHRFQGDIVAIDVIRPGQVTVRDVTVKVPE